MKKNSLIMLLAVTCVGPNGQSQSAIGYTNDARVTLSGGDVRIEASSPRPLYQAITALSHYYGLLIDYEDPVYSDNQMYSTGKNRRLIGGRFVALIPAVTSGETESVSVRNLVNQFSDATGMPFKLVGHTANVRLDVVGQNHDRSLLDTPIIIKKGTRSVDGAINDILAQIAEKTGTVVTRGGFVDNGLLRSQVNFGGVDAKPARDFLSQALDACDLARTWVLAYEPSDGQFYLGIQGAFKDLNDHRIQPIQTRNVGLPVPAP